MTRDVRAGYDHVARGISANSNPGCRDAVLATVDEGHEPAARRGTCAIGRNGLGSRDAKRGHKYRAARLTVVGEAELTPCHLDPVSVEQWCRFRTERHTIHQYRDPRRRPAHGGRAARVHGDDREISLLRKRTEPNAGVVIRSDTQLANAQLDLIVVKPNVSHAGADGGSMRE